MVRKLKQESCCDFLTVWLNLKERKYKRKRKEKEKDRKGNHSMERKEWGRVNENKIENINDKMIMKYKY